MYICIYVYMYIYMCKHNTTMHIIPYYTYMYTYYTVSMCTILYDARRCSITCQYQSCCTCPMASPTSTPRSVYTVTRYEYTLNYFIYHTILYVYIYVYIYMIYILYFSIYHTALYVYTYIHYTIHVYAKLYCTRRCSATCQYQSCCTCQAASPISTPRSTLIVYEKGIEPYLLAMKLNTQYICYW